MGKTFSCEEVAIRYGVKIGTVWAWIREKKLNAVCTGKQYRVREQDLLEYEEARQTVKLNGQ